MAIFDFAIVGRALLFNRDVEQPELRDGGAAFIAQQGIRNLVCLGEAT